MFGCQIEIELIDGSRETIKVPQGCQVGKEIKIANKGFQGVGRFKTGNLIIITQCDIPSKLSQDAEESLKTYAAAVGNTSSTSLAGTISGFFKKFLG